MQDNTFADLPRLTARRLVLMDLGDILALYRAGGRDGAWADAATLTALFSEGEWWGGFADGSLRICCASVPARADTPVAAALRGALCGTQLPDRFLLPPAASCGAGPCAAFLKLLEHRLWPQGRTPWHGPVAAVPVKTGSELLCGYLRAGFILTAMRPLVSLRPHYLLAAPGALACGACCDGRTVQLPLADTLAVSRLLEQGFFGTDVCQGPGEEPVITLCRLSF